MDELGEVPTGRLAQVEVHLLEDTLLHPKHLVFVVRSVTDVAVVVNPTRVDLVVFRRHEQGGDPYQLKISLLDVGLGRVTVDEIDCEGECL